MDRILEKGEIEARVAELEGWTLRGKEIGKQFEFPDFKGALRFVNAVGDRAERVDHHPDILINYNKVTLSLSTHSAGGLTDKDFDLARDIDFI